MSNEKKQPKKPQKRVTIEFPKDLKAHYANIAFITHTPAEMILDFAQVLPRTPKGEIVSRLIMSPIHAKSFLKALETNVANFEKQYGEIKVPEKPHPADQLFKNPPLGLTKVRKKAVKSKINRELRSLSNDGELPTLTFPSGYSNPKYETKLPKPYSTCPPAHSHRTDASFEQSAQGV